MSKILGIICEYNPLHNGHLYHIEESKKIVNPDFTVCIMSDNLLKEVIQRYLINGLEPKWHFAQV